MTQTIRRPTDTMNDVLDIGLPRAMALSPGSVGTFLDLTDEPLRPRSQRCLAIGGSVATVGEHLALSALAAVMVGTGTVEGAIPTRRASPPALDEVVGRLLELFEAENLESGQEHPAESYLAELVLRAPKVALDAVTNVVDRSGLVAPQLLRCVGRLPPSPARKAFYPIVKDALTSSEVGLRDAAVRALEGWGGPDPIHALETHEEPVPWLRDYIQRVLRDLKR